MSFINKMNVSNVSYDIQAGEKVQLTFPVGATNGTLTDEQLSTLQVNYQSCIEMVNDKEIYTLNDNGHTDGYLTYSHVGIENGKTTIKILTITVSAKSFVIATTVVPTESGVKLYLHNLVNVDPVYAIATTSTPMTTYDKFMENMNDILTIHTIDVGTIWFNCGVIGTVIAENKHTLYVYSPIGGSNMYHILISEDMPTMSDTVTEL